MLKAPLEVEEPGLYLICFTCRHMCHRGFQPGRAVTSLMQGWGDFSLMQGRGNFSELPCVRISAIHWKLQQLALFW